MTTETNVRDFGPWVRGPPNRDNETVKGRAVGLALGLALVLSSCSDSPRSLTGLTRDVPLDVSGVTVTDVTDSGAYPSSGEFRFVAPAGHLLVVYFGYTNCPDLCPTTLAEVRSARRRLGDDAARIDLAMVTVDPDRDTAVVMNGFLASFTDRFHALRPATTAELEVAEAAFLASSSITTASDGTIDVSHTANAYVVDDRGEVVVEWPFGHGVDNMVTDLGILLDDTD